MFFHCNGGKNGAAAIQSAVSLSRTLQIKVDNRLNIVYYS